MIIKRLKKIYPKINRRFIFSQLISCILLCAFLSQKTEAQYQLNIIHPKIISEKAIEFEVQIKNTGNDFVLTSYQCVLLLSGVSTNNGQLSFSYISGSSNLYNYPLYSIGTKKEDNILKLCFASDAGYNGKDIIHKIPLRIGRFRVTNTKKFNFDSLSIYWNFSDDIRTLLTDNSFADITIPANFNNFTNSLSITHIPEIKLIAKDSIKIGINYFRKFLVSDKPDSMLSINFESGKYVKVKFKDSFLTLLNTQRWLGTDTIAILVNDGIHTAQGIIPISYIDNYSLPVLDQICNKKMLKNSIKQMTHKFSNYDQTRSYKFTVTSDNENVSMENLAMKGNTITYNLIPAKDWRGNTNVKITIKDDDFSFIKDSLIYNLIIKESNSPPNISHIPAITLCENDSMIIKLDSLKKYVTDNDDLSNDLIYSFSKGIFVNTIADDLFLKLIPCKGSNGIDLIKMKVSDGISGIEAFIPVVVKSIAKDTVFFRTGEKSFINLWKFIDDPEITDSLLKYEFQFSTDLLAALYNNTNGNLEIKPNPNLKGLFKLFLTVKKQNNTIATDTIPINISRALTTSTANNGNKIIPTEYFINQNYPNPFNASTIIKYGIPVSSKVQIVMYNLLGERIFMLLDEIQNAGIYEQRWDAKNVPSGIYFCSLICKALDASRDYNSVLKVLLIK